MEKKTINISTSNVSLLKEIDNSIKEAQAFLNTQVEEYNKRVNALNYQKQFLLKSLINQEDMGDIKTWFLDDEYNLIEQTDEEYKELFSTASVVEHELDNVTL